MSTAENLYTAWEQAPTPGEENRLVACMRDYAAKLERENHGLRCALVRVLQAIDDMKEDTGVITEIHSRLR